MNDVFVSYSREDQLLASKVVQALEARNWSVWWDQEIPTGARFTEVTQKALDEARCIVVLWSKHSVASKWVEVEAGEGAKREVLLPALIEEAAVPLPFRWMQHSDLIHWNGGLASEDLRRFVDEVSAFLEGSRDLPSSRQGVSYGVVAGSSKRAKGLAYLFGLAVFAALILWLVSTQLGSDDREERSTTTSPPEVVDDASGEETGTETTDLPPSQQPVEDPVVDPPPPPPPNPKAASKCQLTPVAPSCELGVDRFQIRATFFEQPFERAVLKVFEKSREVKSESVRAVGLASFPFTDLSGQLRHLSVGFLPNSRQVEVELGEQ